MLRCVILWLSAVTNNLVQFCILFMNCHHRSGFEIVFRGNNIAVSGTSCSTPTFAGVIAALNDIRLNNNKPPLGKGDIDCIL